MDLITIDFETYYDREFSLTKLTTEEYIRDKRFEVIGVGVKVNNGVVEWASGSESQLKDWLLQFDWKNSMALAHNAMFDGAILAWRFGILPNLWLDTLCMGRALHGVEVSNSLAALAQREGLGTKGVEVLTVAGMRREDFSPERLARYGDYCVTDVELTYLLFRKFLPAFPKKELKLIDTTLRMFIEPKLRLDKKLLQEHLQAIQEQKSKLLSDSGVEASDLMSNPKFAEVLTNLGVTPPKKVSPTTGKETYAFAKNDEEFIALINHPDWRVQGLVSARLGLKSTLEETRTQRFIDIAARGTLPVPIKYYAAHTGRFGGDDKINLQNLPSRGENAGKLKSAILAPEGYSIIDSDSSQIEARVLAWLAGQEDLLEVFRKNNEEILAGVPKQEFKHDPYKLMASQIYGKPTTEITNPERFVGKTTILGCFAADTRVLTNSGWKRIVEVQATDLVWDGESWVTHQGVIPKGERETLRAWGVDATPEHEILTEHGWREWYEVVTNPILSQSAFDKARSLSLIGSSTSSPWVDPQGGTPWSGVTVDGKAKLTDRTSSQDVQQGATYALKVRQTQLAKSIGVMKQLFQTWGIGKDCSTALRVLFQGATQRLAKHTRTMVDGVSLFMNPGALTAPLFYSTSSLSPIGTTPSVTLTGLITTKGMNRATFDSQPGVKTPATKEPLKICSRKLQTYDIAYAGPNNRFMIATDVGPLIVHNCGYGMGAVKFHAQLKGSSQANVDLDEARRIVEVYRKANPAITGLWRQAQLMLVAMLRSEPAALGRLGVLSIVPIDRAILLPSKLMLRYDDLKAHEGEKGVEFTYKTRKGRTRIYGGKVVENVCQAIARCIIGEQMLRISTRYKVVLTVHDAVACICKDEEVKEAQAYVEECMRWVPKWAAGLPVNCESGVGKSYGDCD